MSVYTPVSVDDCRRLLAHFELGDFVGHRGIDAGVENTNYFVSTTQGEFVLTLFEHHVDDEVREFVALARHLGGAGMAVPAPIADGRQQWLHSVAGKPAIVCHKLAGEHIANPSNDDCHAIGEWLSSMHLAAQSLTPVRDDIRGYDWWQRARYELDYLLNDDDRELMDDELAAQASVRQRWNALPHGWIHADLFHDNALMTRNEHGVSVGAVLDFYNACHGAWVYDLAVIANDWCCDAKGQWVDGRVDALLDGYGCERPLSSLELELWPMALRAGALRFWLSRLLAKHQQLSKGLPPLENLDPNDFKQRLLLRRTKP